MSVTLNTIRYYTPDDAYHYTSDNRPLSDLEQNDIALKDALDLVTNNTTTKVVVGNWATLSVSFDLHQDQGKPFAYRIKVWATKDQSLTVTQSSTISEDIIVGYSDISGSVTVQQVTNLVNQGIGTGTLVKTFTGNGNNLVISFSGYTGSTGYVVAKAERFGI